MAPQHWTSPLQLCPLQPMLEFMTTFTRRWRAIVDDLKPNNEHFEEGDVAEGFRPEMEVDEQVGMGSMAKLIKGLTMFMARDSFGGDDAILRPGLLTLYTFRVWLSWCKWKFVV